ncbi:MAG: hypothetical protein H0V92_12175 [Pseudonocardiales bacterium]|nr:hypothetical protein [Pseudonocardiales bacterium]
MTTFLPAGDPRLMDVFRGARYSVFRFEALPAYRGSDEEGEIAAFLRGDPPPPRDPSSEDWMAMICGHRAAGRVMERVHAVTEPLTDYLRWELTWGYPPHVQVGEDVRILDLTAGWPDELPRRDFHLFDNCELYDAHYAEDGTWLGVERITDPARAVAACHWRAALWHRAVPLAAYLARHPDLAARVSAPIG